MKINKMKRTNRTKKGRKEGIRKEKIGKWTIRWRVDKFGRCNLSARSMRTHS